MDKKRKDNLKSSWTAADGKLFTGQRKQERGGDEDEAGALHVEAEHGHLAGAVGLAAERLEHAGRAEEEAEGEVGDDGGRARRRRAGGWRASRR